MQQVVDERLRQLETPARSALASSAGFGLSPIQDAATFGIGGRGGPDAPDRRRNIGRMRRSTTVRGQCPRAGSIAFSYGQGDGVRDLCMPFSGLGRCSSIDART